MSEVSQSNITTTTPQVVSSVPCLSSYDDGGEHGVTYKCTLGTGHSGEHVALDRDGTVLRSWATAFTSEIVEDPSVPTPCIVTLPVGGYDLDQDAETGRPELYIHSPADARSVGETLLAVAEISEEAAGQLPLELDSKVSAEDQDRGADYLTGVLGRHRAAVEGFTEAQWAALGKRLVKDQLSDSGSMYVNTSDYISDLSGVSLRQLWLGEES